MISIHAPIVGCDGTLVYDDGVHKNFNPRTHRGVRRGICGKPVDFTKFQSTHPSWGATVAVDLL